jgi:AcrR family transcriptional regulator
MSVTKHIRWNDQEKLADLEAPIDRRAFKTRQALHQTLIRLIGERDYDEITVADIAEAANVGRSTFYAHYTDKDDLLRSGTSHLRNLLRQEHNSAVTGEDRPEQRALGFSHFMTEHLKERHQLYRALMRGRAGPIIIDQIRQFLCEIVRTELTASGHKSSAKRPTPEFAVQFIVGAYMSIVTWWLDRGAREKPEEIDRAFRELALGGLGTWLEA